MPLIIVIILGLWFAFGDLNTTIADWFWSETPAPWEDVDAFFYPNKSDLSKFEMQPNVGSLESCRSWVSAKANFINDPKMQRSDYECGVGRNDEKSKQWGANVYRITPR